MKYIKFDTINSTNDFLKSYAKNNELNNFFYVYADFQEKGRGQRANIWQSECCKNALLSIFIRPAWLLEQQMVVSQITAISIIKVLEKFNIPDLKIKLPNDIMAGDKKIGGILIENIIQQKNWKYSIVGIGLNVNQINFVNLPNACSMKYITKKDYSVEKIIQLIVKKINELYQENPEILKLKFDAYLK